MGVAEPVGGCHVGEFVCLTCTVQQLRSAPPVTISQPCVDLFGGRLMVKPLVGWSGKLMRW